MVTLYILFGRSKVLRVLLAGFDFLALKDLHYTQVGVFVLCLFFSVNTVKMSYIKNVFEFLGIFRTSGSRALLKKIKPCNLTAATI